MARAQPPESPASPAGASEAFRPLTREAISAQTDSGSFSRGASYFRSGHIFAPLRRGPVIQARCHGSSGGPYRVEATLARSDERRKGNPLAYDCDCPRGGFCKHIVALLLTWIDAPEKFTVRPPIAEVLAERSREELIALIERMVRQEPDFETMVELPLPVAGGPSGGPLDEAAWRRQVEAAFAEQQTGRSKSNRRYGWYEYDDWDSCALIADSLQQLVDIADAYADAGDWRNAVAAYAVIADTTIPRLSRFADPNGSLFEIVSQCDVGLAACLDAQAEAPAEQQLTPDERARLIDALLALWEADRALDDPGIAEDGEEAIVRSATPEERIRVGDWLREAARRFKGDDYDRSWMRRAILWFLAQLGPNGGLSDEELLEEYRAAELWDEASDALLRLGRVEEAIGLAARHLGTPALMAFAEALIDGDAPRRIDEALDLIDGRLWEQEGKNPQEDAQCFDWLARQYAAHGRSAKAFDMAKRLFEAVPSKAAYDMVRKAARLPDQPPEVWEKARPKLLAAMKKSGGIVGLIEIHLEDGDVAAAVKALEANKTTRSGYAPGQFGWLVSIASLEARVAEAAESSDPDAAVRIYTRLAEREIEARQRDHYRQAAAHLARVKHVMTDAGRAEQWTADIGELRQRHKSLRALREELDALDLR